MARAWQRAAVTASRSLSLLAAASDRQKAESLSRCRASFLYIFSHFVTILDHLSHSSEEGAANRLMRPGITKAALRQRT